MTVLKVCLSWKNWHCVLAVTHIYTYSPQDLALVPVNAAASQLDKRRKPKLV